MKVLRIFARVVGVISMIWLFIWQSEVAILKYQAKITSLQESLEDNGTLLYPSVSFCIVNIWETYPGVLERIKTQENITMEELRQFAMKNHWDILKLFHFVSHQNIEDHSFPCNTIGGPQKGKPCSFPFIYQSVGKIDACADL